MQPYVHAMDSARRGGRHWQEDLPIHEFMDSAKLACPDLRHRLVLHNADLGPALAAQAFPQRPEAREVALLHVEQDLRWTPRFTDWLERCDPDRLPPLRCSVQDGEAVVAGAAERLRLADAAPVAAVWALLTLPSRIAPERGPPANAFLMNGFGPALARAVLGPPQIVPRHDGGQAVVDFAWLCEGMIVAATGRLLPLARILDSFRGPVPAPPAH